MATMMPAKQLVYITSRTMGKQMQLHGSVYIALLACKHVVNISLSEGFEKRDSHQERHVYQ